MNGRSIISLFFRGIVVLSGYYIFVFAIGASSLIDIAAGLLLSGESILKALYSLPAITVLFLTLVLTLSIVVRWFPSAKQRRRVSPRRWSFIRASARFLRRHIFFTIVVSFGMVIALTASGLAPYRSLFNDLVFLKEHASHVMTSAALVFAGVVKWAVIFTITIWCFFFVIFVDREAALWNNMSSGQRFWLIVRLTFGRIWMIIKIIIKQFPFMATLMPLLDLVLTGIVLKMRSSPELVSLAVFKITAMGSVITPFLVALMNMVEKFQEGSSETLGKCIRNLDDHIVIGGFGRLGRFLAREIFVRYYHLFQRRRGRRRDITRDLFMSPWLNFLDYISQGNRFHLLWAKGVVIDKDRRFIHEIRGEIGGNMVGAARMEVNLREVAQEHVYLPAVVQDVNDPEIKSLLRFSELGFSYS